MKTVNNNLKAFMRRQEEKAYVCPLCGYERQMKHTNKGLVGEFMGYHALCKNQLRIIFNNRYHDKGTPINRLYVERAIKANGQYSKTRARVLEKTIFEENQD